MNINLCLFVYKSKLKKASKNKTKDRYCSIEMVILFDLKIAKFKYFNLYVLSQDRIQLRFECFSHIKN